MWQRVAQRFMRMIRFDLTVFKEIYDDVTANTEVAVIVLVASLFAALGAAVGSGHFWGALVSRFLSGVVLNWLLWSYVTVLVATNLYGSQVDFWQMARVLGYANAPLILAILGLIGCVAAWVPSVAWILSLVIGFFAIRETLNLSTERTIITVAIGWVVVLVVSILLALIF